MSKAVYVQQGETLDYKNSTSKKVEAGTVIALVSRIGIAGCDISPGDTGTIHMAGVYKLLKTKEAEIVMGTPVYFDGTGITSDADDGAENNAVNYIPAGYAASGVVASEAYMAVNLLG